MKDGSVFAVEFHLLPTDDATLPAATGAQAQASLLNLIGRFDPVLASRLHDEPGYRPYTISPLRGGKISGDRITLWRGQPCHLRVTLFDGGALLHALQSYLRGAGPVSVRLCNTDFRLVQMNVTPTPGSASWASSTDWETLVTLPAQSTITMRFETATAFSLGERRFSLFPEPRLVWGSLLRTWNRYAPTSLRIEKPTISESFGKHMGVTGCALRHAYLPKFCPK